MKNRLGLGTLFQQMQSVPFHWNNPSVSMYAANFGIRVARDAAGAAEVVRRIDLERRLSERLLVRPGPGAITLNAYSIGELMSDWGAILIIEDDASVCDALTIVLQDAD